jgi:uncharacterized repeat protein (TIGR01451 family)
MVLPALLMAVVAMAMVWVLQGSPAKAQPATPNITFSAPATADVGSNFDVTISGDTGTVPVNTYGAEISIPAGLSFISGAHLDAADFPSPNPEPVPGPGPGYFGTGANHGPPDAVLSPSKALEKFTLSCDVAGPQLIHLADLIDDPVGGSTWYDAAGVVATNLSPDITVTCKVPPAKSNIVVTKGDSLDPVAAGTPFAYTVKATNMGPAVAVGLVVGDTLPDIADGDGRGMKILNGAVTLGVDINGDTNPDVGPFPCIPGFIGTYPNPFPPPNYFNSTIACSGPIEAMYGVPLVNALPLGASVVVNIPVVAPLAEAGKANFNIGQANLDCGPPLGDPNCTVDDFPANEADCVTQAGALPPANLGCELTMIMPANVTIDKVGDGPHKDGETITWTVTVANGAGSPAGSPYGEGYDPLVASPTLNPVTNCYDNVDNAGSAAGIDFDGAGAGSPDPACGNFGPVITDNVDNASTAGVTSATISVGTCRETGTANALIVDPTGQSAVDVRCSMDAPMAASSSAVLTVQSTAKAPPTTCSDTATVNWADPGSASKTASVGCQPKGVLDHKDKGVAVFPPVVDILVGSHANVIVAETLEIVIPGPSPNLLHTWYANTTLGNGVGLLWVAEAGDTVTPGAPSNWTQDVFQTTGHVPGLITISRVLDVSCTAADGEQTVNLQLESLGLKDVFSPASLIVQCFNQPQEVKVPAVANLWLMRHPNCGPENLLPPCFPDEGKGSILIREVGSAIANDHRDPGGLGAYEKQIKFDHKLFLLKVTDSGFLGSTGRSVNCTMTIVTENWIMFGCVSVGDMDGPTSSGPVVLTNILVKPQPDLFLRLHPTKNNGVVSNIIDENCEWADRYGNPMAGSVNGGLIPVCTSSTITVRMLEGDLNNDCNVDVLDEQGIAFRYGSSFGLQLYNGYYDLEPQTGDFDIDIKDLQFVFGRDGSTCTNPIPAQPPASYP